MKIFIAGGTGLLGYHSALAFLARGDGVRALAIPDVELGDWYPKEIELLFGDVFTLPEEKLTELMRGCDALVWAVGPDDRVTPPAPAYAFFHERLVVKCANAVRAARAAGIRKCVILNSYFATFDRMEPALRLAERHPYIRCRVEQAAEAAALGGDGMEVCILELPYIFGTMPGRTPIWKHLLIDRLQSMNPVFFPQGGTAMVAVGQVAEAVVGAVVRGRHGERYPVADVNMEWKHMLGVMLRAMGEKRKVIYLPKCLVTAQGRQMAAEHRRQGRESGLNPLFLFDDILCRFLYLDPGPARAALGYGKGNLEDAITESVLKCL